MTAVLIAGARGMLGWELAEHFSAIFPKHSVVALGREALDVTSPESVKTVLKNYKPATLVNCAAYTNVDGAETEKEKALLLNARSPELLAGLCHDFGAKLVHFSTDQVFDGTARNPVTEQDPVSPSNYYAQTKWLGEEAVLSFPEHLVLRVQWLYGKRKDRFTPLRDKKIFTPFEDQFGAPTWTRHISETLFEMLHRDARGLFHFSYDDYASWAEVFAFAAEVMELPLQLIPKKTSEVSLPARRPSFSVMSNWKLRNLLGRDKMGSWKSALRDFLLSLTSPA